MSATLPTASRPAPPRRSPCRTSRATRGTPRPTTSSSSTSCCRARSAGARSSCTGPTARRWRWRTPAGTGCCRCRRASLEGDEVVCGYHGLMYDGDGRCTFMPSQKTINPSARVRSYPVVERHRFVWVWTGDPALADPATVPDLHWNDDPEWAGDGKLIHAECNYKLVVDNLMDLTHETFVHGSSIGQRSIAEVAVRGHPRPGHRHRHPLDDRRRAAAVLEACSSSGSGRAGRQRRPLADHPLPGARRRSRSTSASRRPAPARPRATAPRASTASCSTR